MDRYNEYFNPERVNLSVELALHAAAARDYVGVAIRDARRCVEIVTDARIDGGTLSGRALNDLLQTLTEIENDLSRADGELAE